MLADLSPEEAKESVVGVFLAFPQLVEWQSVPPALQLASTSSSNQVYQTVFPVLDREKGDFLPRYKSCRHLGLIGRYVLELNAASSYKHCSLKHI